MNTKDRNESLVEIVQQFQEWDDQRGITEHSSAKAQYSKLFEEVMELGRNIYADQNGQWFKRKMQGELNRLHSNGKLKVHPDGEREGVIDGVGDSLKCLQSVASHSSISLGEAAEVAYNAIKDRTGKLDRHGVWVKNEDTV